MIEVIRDLDALRRWRRAQEAVTLVPTMGALHEGHQDLIRAAAARAGSALVSVFVNPTQFGPNEDFDRYPRDAEGDVAKAEAAGADAVWMPPVEVMYPEGHRTTVSVSEITDCLCGASRPGHFDGVCTVVLKLLNMTGCDAAIFGEKDYQQLAVIRRMVADLDVPVEIVGHPIVREPDGLAMSSRNRYLSPSQRQSARALSRALAAARGAYAEGERDPRALEAVAREIVEAAPGARVDYIALRAADLAPAEGKLTGPAVLALAVLFGETRLIDNIVLK